ncbi:MAG: universal stress protein, partial [Salinibacter sp.]
MLHAANILCLGTPASAAPTQALPLARHLGAPLHGLPFPPLSGDAASKGPPVSPEEADEVSVQVPESPPESMAEVLQYVADADIDLVVVDTPPDREPVPPLAVDAAKRLARQLPCPVFVVEHVERPATIRDILVPTDLSEHALRAFRHAVNLARLYDASVHVLHVVDSLPYVALTPTDRLSLGPTPLSEHRGRRRVRAFLQEEEAEDVSLHVHLAYGDPADQVARFADREAINLMVLASHGRSSRPASPLGQVAERILGRVTCPLFLIPSFGASLLEARPDSESLS